MEILEDLVVGSQEPRCDRLDEVPHEVIKECTLSATVFVDGPYRVTHWKGIEFVHHVSAKSGRGMKESIRLIESLRNIYVMSGLASVPATYFQFQSEVRVISVRIHMKTMEGDNPMEKLCR